jgi:hypothetical protein
MNKLPENLTLEKIVAAVQEDDNLGFCIACGEPADSVEPDARKYQCDTCGALAVYGAEELLLMFA